MPRLPELLHARFLAPRHAGTLDDPSAQGEGANAACGDHLRLQLRVAAGRIEAARFQARGCSAALACADVLAEHLQGLAPEEAARLDVGALVRSLGGLAPAQSHAIRVAQRALDGALADLRARCHP